MRRRRDGRRIPGVSRHLMEPDPEAPPLPSLRYLLWLCAFVLGAIVTALQLAS